MSLISPRRFAGELLLPHYLDASHWYSPNVLRVHDPWMVVALKSTFFDIFDARAAPDTSLLDSGTLQRGNHRNL